MALLLGDAELPRRLRCKPTTVEGESKITIGDARWVGRIECRRTLVLVEGFLIAPRRRVLL